MSKGEPIEKKVSKVIKYIDRLKIAKDICDELELKGDVRMSENELQKRIIEKEIEFEKAERAVEKAKATAPLNIDLIVNERLKMKKVKYELEFLKELQAELF